MSAARTTTAAVVPVENNDDAGGHSSSEITAENQETQKRTFPCCATVFLLLVLITLNTFAVATCKFLSWDGTLSWSWDNYGYDWFVPAPELDDMHQTAVNGLFRSCEPNQFSYVRRSNEFFDNFQHMRGEPDAIPVDSAAKTAAQIMGIIAIFFGVAIFVYCCHKIVKDGDENMVALGSFRDRIVLVTACAFAGTLSLLTLVVFASEECYDKDCEPKDLCSYDAPTGTYCYSKCHVHVGSSASIIAGISWLILGLGFLLWNRKKPKSLPLKEEIKLVRPSVRGHHTTRWKNYHVLADSEQAKGHVTGTVYPSDTYVRCNTCGAIFKAINEGMDSHNRFHLDEEVC